MKTSVVAKVLQLMLINITCAKIAQVQKWNYICCQNNFYAHFAYYLLLTNDHRNTPTQRP